MFKLLNRFAWILSLSFGFIITFIIIGSNDYRVNGEDIFFSGVLGFIAGIIIKRVLFSKRFITKRLEFFAKSLKENYFSDYNNNSHVKQNINTTDNKTSTITEIQQENKIEKIKTEKIKIEKINKENSKLEKIADLKNSQNYTIPKKPNVIEQFFIKLVTYIKDFFSTNLLAKLGGILVFLAVVYFLKGVATTFWEIIGPVGRITIGIIIGFIIYGTGIKIHKTHKNEGIILMGTGILINYAVILAGRYLVGGNGYLTETTTFFFLILNTILGIITSLIYNSKTLLIFSFVFAYLNPFIIGAKSNGEPYTLIGYSLIISLAGLFLSFKKANFTLLIISFIAGNFLFLVAPFSESIGWSSKIVLTSILSLLSIVGINKFKSLNINTTKITIGLFIGSYIFIVLNLLNSHISQEGMLMLTNNALETKIGLYSYLFTLLGLFIFTIHLIKNNSSSFLSIFLIFPLVILTGILISGILINSYVILLVIIVYLVAYNSLENNLKSFSYIYFVVPILFIISFDINLFLHSQITKSLSLGIKNIHFIGIEEIVSLLIITLIYLFFTYFYSIKEKLTKLFPIGTIGTIVLLLPITYFSIFIIKYDFIQKDLINFTNTKLIENLTILSIIIFALANLSFPFINKNLIKKENLWNLITGILFGALFFAFQIYNYGKIYFPGTLEGFAFLGLAIIYFLEGFFIVNKLGIENVKKDENLKNIFYIFTGISISLFSIAIAFVFSNYPEIITTTWLFEATILYYFYSKTNSPKIFTAATILFIIGLTKFGILLDVVHRGDFKFLISFAIILLSFILNLYFINKAEKKLYQNIHHVLHLVGMLIMGGLLIKIIPHSYQGWNMLGISIFITILGIFYAKYNFKFLKIIFIIILALFSIFHIGELNNIFGKLSLIKKENLKFIQYIVTAIIISNYFIWDKLNLEKKYNKIILTIIGIYSFIISNLFILDLFEKIFGFYTLTIYWGLIASALLLYGIQKNIIKYRTLGLYFLTLTSAKIFLYDIWQIGNTNSRVIVFAILGVIFIILSTLYTKKYGDNMKGEFNLNNLFKNKQQKKNYTNNKSKN